MPLWKPQTLGRNRVEFFYDHDPREGHEILLKTAWAYRQAQAAGSLVWVRGNELVALSPAWEQAGARKIKSWEGFCVNRFDRPGIPRLS